MKLTESMVRLALRQDEVKEAVAAEEEEEMARERAEMEEADHPMQ